MEENITPQGENNYSKAKRKYWATKTTEEKSAQGKLAATLRWANTSPEDKRAHALKMVEGRNKKRAQYIKDMQD